MNPSPFLARVTAIVAGSVGFPAEPNLAAMFYVQVIVANAWRLVVPFWSRSPFSMGLETVDRQPAKAASGGLNRVIAANRHERALTCVLVIASLEAVLQTELNCTGPVCVDWMKEGVAGEAVGPPRKVCAGRIVWTAITTDRVAARIAEVGIVDAEL